DWLRIAKLSGYSLRGWNAKGVVLQFRCYPRIPLDDDAEGLRLHRGKGVGIQIGLIPKTVAVACAFKLIFQNGKEGLAHLGTGDMIFRQAANPDIDIVWRRVSRGKPCLSVKIGR